MADRTTQLGVLTGSTPTPPTRVSLFGVMVASTIPVPARVTLLGVLVASPPPPADCSAGEVPILQAAIA